MNTIQVAHVIRAEYTIFKNPTRDGRLHRNSLGSAFCSYAITLKQFHHGTKAKEFGSRINLHRYMFGSGQCTVVRCERIIFCKGGHFLFFSFLLFPEVVPLSVSFSFVVYCLKHPNGMIQINHKFSKSRNLVEHGFRLEGHQGEIIQALDDGYNLVKFNQFLIRKQVKINRRVKWILVPLEWYVHNDDVSFM